MIEDSGKKLASFLLQIKAIQINVQNPFTWTSGWKSPIYCDNRKVLSYPEVRNYVRDQLCVIAKEEFNPTVVAGVATAGIPHGALVADQLGLPYVYVRSKAKAHGMQNKIEGTLPPNSNVLVVEDTISTGKSSLEAVDALIDAGANINGMIALYSYGFQSTIKRFEDRNLKVRTIAEYKNIIAAAQEMDIITAEQQAILIEWRRNPGNWNK